MPIPVQNEFLLSFLRILSDGSEYTRGQIMFRLAQHFGISKDAVWVSDFEGAESGVC